MQVLRIENGSITLSMNKLLNKSLKSDLPNSSSPADPNLFKNAGDQTALTQSSKDAFAPQIARLLFLARFILLDMLLAVCYSTKETTKATKSSLLKLKRILSCVKSTANLYRYISTEPFDGIVAYVDASFAGHDDFHSQSGLVIEQ